MGLCMWRKNQLVGVRACLEEKSTNLTNGKPQVLSLVYHTCIVCVPVARMFGAPSTVARCYVYYTAMDLWSLQLELACHLGPAAQLMVRAQQPDAGSLLSTTTRGLKTTAKHVPLPVIVTIATTSRRREGKKYQQPDVYWVQNYLKF